MKLKYEFILTDMGDEIDAVPVGENASEFHGMLRLDKDSAEVLELLKEDTTPAEVHQKMIERHPESTTDEIGFALAEFFNKLISEGVLSVP